MNAPIQVNPAAAAAPVQAGAEPRQYLTFMLSGDAYGVGILNVKEIIEYTAITPVPMMPDCINGVINLRGSVVPVMDLAARFGKPPSTVTRRSCIVIVEVGTGSERQDMGVLVDAVNAVLEIPPSDIESAPAFGAKIQTDFIAGIAKVNGKFVILLDVGRVMSAEEIGALALHSEHAAP